MTEGLIIIGKFLLGVFLFPFALILPLVVLYLGILSIGGIFKAGEFLWTRLVTKSKPMDEG